MTERKIKGKKLLGKYWKDSPNFSWNIWGKTHTLIILKLRGYNTKVKLKCRGMNWNKNWRSLRGRIGSREVKIVILKKNWKWIQKRRGLNLHWNCKASLKPNQELNDHSVEEEIKRQEMWQWWKILNFCQLLSCWLYFAFGSSFSHSESHICSDQVRKILLLLFNLFIFSLFVSTKFGVIFFWHSISFLLYPLFILFSLILFSV